MTYEPIDTKMRLSISTIRRLVSEALKNAYDVLGVPTHASNDDIKRAWRRLMISHHPDRGGDHGTSVNLNKAYQVLSTKDETERAGKRFSPFFSEFEGDTKPVAPIQKPQAEAPKRPTYRCPWCSRDVGGYRTGLGYVGFENHRTPKDEKWCDGSREDVNSKGPSAYSGSKRSATGGDNASRHKNPGSQSTNVGRSDGTYKVYRWKSSRRVVRVKNKLYGTEPWGKLRDGSGFTKFNSGDRAKVNLDPKNGRMNVSKTDSDHTQTWDPIDEARRLIDELVIEDLLRVGR